MAVSKKGVLTRKQIKTLGIISKEFKEDSLRAASYDLRVGDEFYIPTYEKDLSPGRRVITEDQIRKCSLNNNVLCIPKCSSAVFSTLESLHMPSDVVGRFDMRIAYAMPGLVLQVGPQVEPNYQGKLFGLLLNQSDEDIHIPYGERLLTIEFNYTCEPVAPRRKDAEEYDSLYEFLENKKLIKSSLDTFLKDINETYKETKKIAAEIQQGKDNRWRNNVTYFLAGLAIVYSVSIPFAVTHLTKATLDYDDYPIREVKELEFENAKLKERNEDMEQKLEMLYKKVDSLVNGMEKPQRGKIKKK